MLSINLNQLERYHFIQNNHDRSQWENYKSRFRKINNYFKAKEFTKETIEEYLLSLYNYSPSTISLIIDELKAICAILGVDFMSGIKKPKRKKVKKYVLFDEEMIRFLEVAYQSSYRYGLACELSLRKGLRFNEVRNIRWVDLIGHELTLKNTKSNEEQMIFLEDDLVKKINNLNHYKHGYIFGNDNGLLSGHSINRFMKKILAKATIRKPMTFHDLRHSCASDLVAHDVNMYTIKEYLRHKNITTTEQYCHINPKTIISAGKKHTLSSPNWTKEDLQQSINSFVAQLSRTPYKPLFFNGSISSQTCQNCPMRQSQRKQYYVLCIPLEI